MKNLPPGPPDLLLPGNQPEPRSPGAQREALAEKSVDYAAQSGEGAGDGARRKGTREPRGRANAEPRGLTVTRHDGVAECCSQDR